MVVKKPIHLAVLLIGAIILLWLIFRATVAD